jgi:hypothetical protein
MILIIYFISILVLVCPQEAHAYIDLGSGSYLIQAVIAIVLGMLFTLKNYFRRILDFFRKNKR